MICTNAFTQAEVVPLHEFIQFLTVLNPFAPHLAEEIHARLAAVSPPAMLLSESTWPAYDPAALVRDEIELVVQVNGKLRDRLMISKDADEAGRHRRRPRQPEGQGAHRRQDHPQDRLRPRQAAQHRRQPVRWPKPGVSGCGKARNFQKLTAKAKCAKARKALKGVLDDFPSLAQLCDLGGFAVNRGVNPRARTRALAWNALAGRFGDAKLPQFCKQPCPSFPPFSR